jgi:hypothetical protein
MATVPAATGNGNGMVAKTDEQREEQRAGGD